MGNRPCASSLISTCAVALSLIVAGPAWAGPFPIEETFTQSTAGAHWVLGGSATLTASKEAEGWLRLTPAENSQFGFAYDNEAFPSTSGALVEFEYADWGGSGADGLTFFLFNGATTEAEFHPGQPGGSLGYAPCNSASNGLSNAYIGVGFDEYGNFTNLKPLCGLDGEAFLPNHVTVRGSKAETYRLLTSAETAESLRAERTQARRVTIAITPTGKLSVYIRFPDGTYQRVTQGVQLPTAPATLKFGYVASTGSLSDDHEIRQARVAKPTQLTPTITQTGGGKQRGQALTWTATVRNEGPNAAQKASVRTSASEPLADVAWTCEAAGGATCATAAGTGLPNLNAGAMPEGSHLTYKITGAPTAEADYAQMTVEAEPLGEAGELDPEKDKATATTDLTPLFNKAPSFTLAASGLATATPGHALGGGITYSDQWQRCEPSGSSCTNITGAKAATYQTSVTDRGHTIRFTQAATNTAASIVADSPVYEPLPTATITSAPSSYVASTEASLAFTSTTSEASFECSLDEATWSACSSPQSYSGLAAGVHAFSVRASYGGLSGPAPASATWTVELTTPHAPTIISAPPSHSPQSTATFKFSGLEKNDALECQIDNGAWTPCNATAEFATLANGVHHLEARQVDRAGVDSIPTAYTWTIETTPPPEPVATSEPEAETTQTSANFSYSHEPEARIECALDGKPYVDCTSGMSVSSLTEGWHTMAARQVNAAGLVSKVATYRWHVGPKAIPKPKSKSTVTKSKVKHKHRHRHEAKRRKAGLHRTESESEKTKPKPKSGPELIAKPKVETKREREPKSKPTAKPKAQHKPKTTPTPRPKPKPTARTTEPTTEPEPQTSGTIRNAKPKAKVRPKVRTKPKVKTKLVREPKPKPKTHPKPKANPKSSKQAKPTVTPKAETEPNPKTATKRLTQPKPETKPKTKPTQGVAPGPTPAPSPDTQATPKTTPSPTVAPKPAPRGKAKSAPTTAPEPEPSAEAEQKGTSETMPLIGPFAPGSWALVAQARRRVDEAAAEIGDARRVTCIGYTDNSGDNSGNREIGLRRARAVCAALRALGVHASFEAKSGSDTRPLSTNTTAAGRRANRRVELRVVY
jgi:outer membrane protein OmpA-like peptidoglycan-associated protein